MPLQEVEIAKKHSQNTTTQFPIYVTPLPEDIKEQDLKFLFSLFGKVTKVKIFKKSLSYTYSYGFVYFDSFEAKQKAKKLCNGKMLGWKSLTVQDGMKNELKNKKFDQNWHNETFYEEASQKYQSKPKKKVHTNEKAINIDQSLGNSTFKRQRYLINQTRNSSRPYPQVQKQVQKSPSSSKYKQSSKNIQQVPSPKKWDQKSRKGHSSCLANKVKEQKEIDY